jgi:hypothetical protein
LLAGRISCIVGLLSGSANTSAGILGIAFCILGYYLDSRKLATATIFLCTAAVLLGLAASQGLIS